MKDQKLNVFNFIKVVVTFLIAFILHYTQHLLGGFPGTQLSLPKGVNDYILTHGNVSVEVFFVMSGALYACAYRKKVRDGNIKLLDFMIKRGIRIWPMAMIATTVLYGQQWLVHHYMNRTWSISGSINPFVWLGDIFYVRAFAMGVRSMYDMPMNGPVWYVSVLLFCYVIAFFLSRLDKENRKAYLYAIPMMVGAITRMFNLQVPLLTSNWCRGYYAFFAGILMYVLLEKINTLEEKRQNFVKWLAAMIFLLIMVGADSLYKVMAEKEGVVFGIIGIPALCIWLYYSKWCQKLSSTSWIEKMSNISYSCLMWNFPVLCSYYLLINMDVLDIARQGVLIWGMVFITHIVVAVLSYHLIEKKLSLKIVDKYKKCVERGKVHGKEN